jgi:hypothetical protein
LKKPIIQNSWWSGSSGRVPGESEAEFKLQCHYYTYINIYIYTYFISSLKCENSQRKYVAMRHCYG